MSDHGNKLRLRSAPAFRDLGGIVTTDGRRVRCGLLFRSEALVNLSEDEEAAVVALGIRVICDLRSRAERDAQPCLNCLEPAARRMSFDLAAELSAGTARALERMRTSPCPDAALQMMLSTYEWLPQAAAAPLRQIFAGLASGEAPLIIHCSAGKDRTGFVSAMVLAALGVPIERVYEDYLRVERDGVSAHAVRTARIMSLFLQKPLDPESLAVVSTTRRDYLKAAFDAVAYKWGDIDRYLSEAAGLDASRREALQTFLLEN
jgi:protein-tyrosine phosphatase